MKKRLLSLLLLGASMSALAGCDNSSFVLDKDLNPVNINSLYDGLVAMYQTKNYTFDIVYVNNGYREDIPNMIFTENYIGYDGAAPEDLNVLLNDGNGIYHVRYSDDFQSGEYLKDKKGKKITKLWKNDDVVNTMYGVGGAYIKTNCKADTKELTISDKDYKIGFLKTITGKSTDFTNVDSLVAKFDGEKVVFDLSIGKGTSSYKVTLKKIGETKSTHLKTFVSNGGKVFEASKDLTEMRRLIQGNNYIQRTYSIVDGEGYFSGYQYFTEHYFFQTGSDANVGNAYMEFDYKDDPALDNDFDMWGIYLVNVFKNEKNEIDAGLVASSAYNSSTKSVIECCKYPGCLQLFDYLEYVKEGELRDAKYDKIPEVTNSKKYYVLEDFVVRDFVRNFSLDTGFQDVNFKTLGIEIQLGATDKDSIIVFHAIGTYVGDNLTYDIIIPLYSFGGANRNALDILYGMYNK